MSSKQKQKHTSHQKLVCVPTNQATVTTPPSNQRLQNHSKANGITSATASTVLQQSGQAFVTSIVHQSPTTPANIPCKKYILYLEPNCSSHLYESILRFFELSESKHGRNEAHMYHPHTSLTGFFDIPIVHNVDFDLLLMKSLDSIVSTATLPLKSAPKLLGVQLSKNQASDSLQIGLEPPRILKDFVLAFKQAVDELIRIHYLKEDAASVKQQQQASNSTTMSTSSYPPSFRVRHKPVDHVSLAYLRNVRSSAGGDRLSEQTLISLEMMAKEIVKLETVPDEWFMVLYQVNRSDDINTSHKFRELKRWKVA